MAQVVYVPCQSLKSALLPGFASARNHVRHLRINFEHRHSTGASLGRLRLGTSINRHNGPVTQHTRFVRPPPDWRSRWASGYARPGRQQLDHPQSDLFAALSDYPAHPLHLEYQTSAADPKDSDPRLYGMWCWKGTVTMGQGSSSSPGQDWPHEGRRWTVLAARDSRKQPASRAG